MNAEGLELYGQFVGSWDVESSLQGRGEWHFEWILGGRAVQDVIYRVGDPEEKHGTTVRAYDARTGLWHLFYACPGDDEFVLLTGRGDGDRIVQEGRELAAPGRAVRWSFSEITPASFLWQGEASTDGGESWSLFHEMRAVRRN